MLRACISTLVLLCSLVSASARVLPCDVVTPVLCYGMRLQKASGPFLTNALSVIAPSNNASGTVNFLPDGSIDTAALDSILGGTQGLIQGWFDQQAGVALVPLQLDQLFFGNTHNSGSDTFHITGITPNTSSLTAGSALYGLALPYSTIINSIDSSSQISINQIAFFPINGTAIIQSRAPGIKTRTLGAKNTRSIVFEGGNISGANFGLKASQDLSALAITAKEYTVIMTVRMPNGMPVNQGSAPGVWPYTLFNLFRDGTGSVAQLQAHSNEGARPSWDLSDDGATFRLRSSRHISNNVTVVASVVSASGTRSQVFVNGHPAIDSTTVPTLVRTANNIYIGTQGTSTNGGFSGAGSFEALSVIVYNTALSAADIMDVTSSLQEVYGIDRYLDTYDVNALWNVGDSIGAGYVTFGIHGYMDILQDSLLTKKTRVSSMAIPGSTASVNTNGLATIINGTVSLFTPMVCDTIRGNAFKNKSKIVIVSAGGNDPGIGPAFRTGNVVTGGNVVSGLANTADLNVGDFIHSFFLNTLSTIQSKTSNTITITPGTFTGTANGLGIESSYAFLTPAFVKANLDSIANQAFACGATHVIGLNILPRVTASTPWLNALRTLIVAGGPYTTVNCNSFGNLGTIPGVDYADSGHLSDAGQLDLANCLANAINPMLTTVTPP